MFYLKGIKFKQYQTSYCIFVQSTTAGFFMRKILLIAILLLIHVNLFCQKSLISNRENLDLRNDDFAIIGKFNHDIISYIKHSDRHFLLVLDSVLKKKRKVEVPFLNNDCSHIEFFAFEKNCFLFYDVKKGRTLSRYMSKFSNESAFSEPMRVLEMTQDANGKMKSFDVYASENGMYFAVNATKLVDNYVTAVSVLINYEGTIEQQIEKVLLNDNWVLSNKMELSNQGEFYWLALKNPSNKGSSEAIKLIVLRKGAAEFSIQELDLQNYTVNDLNLKLHEKDKVLYVVGTYANGLYSNSQGCYLNQYNISSETFLTPYFASLLLASGKKDIDMKDLKLKKVSLKQDGGLEIAMEKSYQQIRTVNSFNSSINMSMGGMMDNSRIVNEFYYDEIDIFNFGTDGKLVWSQTVLKNQMSTDDNGIFSSYGCHEYEIGKVYLFSNNSLNSDRLMGAYVSSKGAMNVKEIPLSMELDNYNLLPRSSVQISKHEIIIPCLSKDYLRLLKINF